MKTLTEFSGVVLRAAHAAREQKAADGTTEDQLAEAVGEEIGVGGDRLERLFEALRVVGDKLADARLVRVYQGEQAPERAKSIGEFHYVVDFVSSPRDDRRGGRGGRDARGGRGGRDGRGRPGGPRGAGGPGGPRGAGGPGGPGRGGGYERREREPRGKEVPSAGAGWSLQRAPGSDSDQRGRPRKGPKRRPPRRAPDGRRGEAGRGGGGRAAGPRRDAAAAKPSSEAGADQRPKQPRKGDRPAPSGRRPRGPKPHAPEPTVELRKSGLAPPKKKRKRKRRRGKKPGADTAAATPATTSEATPPEAGDVADPPPAPPKPRRVVVVPPPAPPPDEPSGPPDEPSGPEGS